MEDFTEKRIALLKIKMLMEFWNISVQDIARASPALPPPVRAARYQHPHTGDAWDGEGRQPDWLRRALLKEGFTVEELRVAVPVDKP